jgi:ribosomal protein S18 acetylase RimI-like enzyme
MKNFSQLISQKPVEVLCENLNSELVYLKESGDQVGSLVLVYRDNSALIFSVEVLSNHRGKGYGKSLVEKAILRASERGCLLIELNTEQDNKVANNLYQSMGFDLVGIKDNFNNYRKLI